MAHGFFKWHDLLSPDVEASRAFYSALFDWQILDESRAGAPYPTIWAAGRKSGGILAAGTSDQARWLSYIKVDDVDASARRVAVAGGAVEQGPADVDSLGRLAVCRDPHGAEFGLLTPPRGPRSSVMLPGTFAWHELDTPDWERSADFYNPVVGWTTIAYPVDGFGTYREFSGEVAGLGAMEGLPSSGRREWLIWFAVDDTATGVRRAVEAGASVETEPIEFPQIGTYAVLRDPLGARFAMLSVPADDPRRKLWNPDHGTAAL